MRIRVLAVFGVIAACCSSAADGAGCTSKFSFYFGRTVSQDLVVRSGGRCKFTFRAGGMSEFNDVQVSERPKHGSVGANTTYATYRPVAGYKGPDSFTIAIIGRNRANSEPAKIAFDVTVR